MQNLSNTVAFRNALLLAAALLMGNAALRSVHAAPDTTPPKTLTAQEFQLVDKEGNKRGLFGLQPDGSPYIALLDKQGKAHVTVRIRPDGSSSYAMNDPDGTNRVLLDTRTNGSASISVSNRQGKGGAEFLVPPDGNPYAVIKDKEGKVVWAEPSPELEVLPDDKEKPATPPK